MDEALVVVGGLTLVFLVPLPLPHVLHDVCVQRDIIIIIIMADEIQVVKNRA